MLYTAKPFHFFPSSFSSFSCSIYNFFKFVRSFPSLISHSCTIRIISYFTLFRPQLLLYWNFKDNHIVGNLFKWGTLNQVMKFRNKPKINSNSFAWYFCTSIFIIFSSCFISHFFRCVALSNIERAVMLHIIIQSKEEKNCEIKCKKREEQKPYIISLWPNHRAIEISEQWATFIYLTSCLRFALYL